MKKYPKTFNSSNMIRAVILLILLIYIFVVLYITLINRVVGIRRSMLTPFWELRTMLQSHNYKYWLGQIGGNLIMLFPLGIMLPIVCDKFRSAKTVAAAFAFSIFIETTQYVTGRGLCEFDDVFHNTLGALIGYLIFRLVYDLIQKNKSEQ